MKVVDAMTLREKIGQMLLCGFAGTEADEALEELIREHRIGGVIYFARNVADTRQVARLSERLQQIARQEDTVPLWVSIDQEGGVVARITEGVALMPGQMALAAGRHAYTNGVYEAAFVSGKELRSLGINLNFAPVLDVNNNPDNPVIGVRSFGESTELVAVCGSEAVQGYQAAGVAATAKHFPGHGDTSVDSHLDLPTVAHSAERIRAVELAPFVKAIENGVDAIMSSHIVFPALDEKRPATLSKAILSGLLREKLGYKGVIMTDCMEMNAIAGHFGTTEAAVMAVEAGADLVLISHSRERQIAAIAAIECAVREGRLTEARIDASVERLLALKRRRGLFAPQPPAEDGLSALGTPGHIAVARRLSEASITLVKDEQGLLPLRSVRTLAVTAAAAVSSEVDEAYGGPASLGAALAAGGLDVVDRVVPLAEIGGRTEALLADAKEAEQIVVGTYNARFYPAQAELVRALQSLGKPLVVVALRVPYDLLDMPDVSTFLAAYESRPLALQSAAGCLLGRLSLEGRLPVSLPPHYPAGWRWERER